MKILEFYFRGDKFIFWKEYWNKDISSFERVSANSNLASKCKQMLTCSWHTNERAEVERWDKRREREIEGQRDETGTLKFLELNSAIEAPPPSTLKRVRMSLQFIYKVKSQNYWIFRTQYLNEIPSLYTLYIYIFKHIPFLSSITIPK